MDQEAPAQASQGTAPPSPPASVGLPPGPRFPLRVLAGHRPPHCTVAAEPDSDTGTSQVMEDEGGVQGVLPPLAASLESKSKRKKTPPSVTCNCGGHGRGRGSTDTNTHMEALAEDEDNGENFATNAASAISVSVPTDDDASQQEDGDSSVKRGKRAGINLSPSKTKLKREKRAGCWKYFKEIHVQSKKEFGVMVSKAKCRFCHKSYIYHPGGATSQLNCHLSRCTQFQNKLAKAKRQLAQGRR